MVRAERKTDKGVWSGVEGGRNHSSRTTATARNCMRIPFQAAGATRKADAFISRAHLDRNWMGLPIRQKCISSILRQSQLSSKIEIAEIDIPTFR